MGGGPRKDGAGPVIPERSQATDTKMLRIGPQHRTAQPEQVQSVGGTRQLFRLCPNVVQTKLRGYFTPYPSSEPELMMTSVPVMYDDASLARNRQSCPTSSGVPLRPVG